MPLRENPVLDRMLPTAEPRWVMWGRRGTGSSAADTLLGRAALLDDRDRLLVELALRNGASNRQLGRVLGIPAGTVSRRLRRLLRRLHEPIVAALTEPSINLPPEYRQLGIEHFVRGLTSGQLADLHQMNVRRVQQMLTHLRGWHEGLSSRPRER